MDIFQQIKNSTSIVEVAEFYGVRSRKNKASCPFHEDKTPSMSFKNNKFKCFSCGQGGTAIDLVSKILNCSVIDAAKNINESFSLGIMLGEKPNMEAVNKLKIKRRKEEAFKAWEKKMFLLIADCFKKTQHIWIEDLAHWWINANEVDKLDFFLNNKKVVIELERTIGEF